MALLRSTLKSQYPVPPGAQGERDKGKWPSPPRLVWVVCTVIENHPCTFRFHILRVDSSGLFTGFLRVYPIRYLQLQFPWCRRLFSFQQLKLWIFPVIFVDEKVFPSMSLSHGSTWLKEKFIQTFCKYEGAIGLQGSLISLCLCCQTGALPTFFLPLEFSCQESDTSSLNFRDVNKL